MYSIFEIITKELAMNIRCLPFVWQCDGYNAITVKMRQSLQLTIHHNVQVSPGVSSNATWQIEWHIIYLKTKQMYFQRVIVVTENMFSTSYTGSSYLNRLISVLIQLSIGPHGPAIIYKVS
jgi:hypothetical protein